MTNRREFLKKSGLAAGAMAMASGTFAQTQQEKYAGNEGKFKLKYAPSFGSFKESAPSNQADYIKYIADLGFRALFDNGLPKKDKPLQNKIASALSNYNIEMGPFVLYADFKVTSFVEDKKEVREMLKTKMKEGVELAKRVGAKTALIVPGKYHAKLAWEYQTANVIENLRFCAEQLDALNSDLTLVMEPLNSHVNHPGLFLTKIPQSYMICRAVNSPHIKIVNDLYHQQIQEGNLINNLKMAYSEIGAFHVGDNPGRKEPTSGEINYRNIFKTLYDMGYDGTICMEHGKSLPGIEGEKKLLEAYRWCDDFL